MMVRKLCLTAFALVVYFDVAEPSSASPGAVDLTFDPGSRVEYAAGCFAVQADGKVVIGGSFPTPRIRVARLNADGTVDSTFDPGEGPNRTVRQAVLQPDGKVLICGEFTTVNQTNRNRIARLNPDGSLDIAFDPGTGANGTVDSIALQDDGLILAGGLFTNVNGMTRMRIARFHSDGNLDSTFVPSVEGGDVFVVDILSDGKILLGGSFTNINGVSRNRIARLNADGSLDTTFDPGTGPNGTVSAIIEQPDGGIVVGGSFSSVNGKYRPLIAGLNADGSLTSFSNLGLSDSVRSLALQADGKILVAGYGYIVRLNINGGLDGTFNTGTGPDNGVSEVAVLTDGKILLCGGFSNFDGTMRNSIARLQVNGSLDYDFVPDSGADFHVLSVALQADLKVLIGGEFRIIDGITCNYIARLNTNGSLDRSFNPFPGANDHVYSVAPQADGKIIIGGLFTNFGGVNRNRIARLNTNGSLDSTFDPGTGADNWVESVVVQTNGSVIIGGWFTSINGTGRGRIARLNPDGSLDTTFDPGSGASAPVNCVALQTDGKVILGGAFSSVNGVTRSAVARLNTDGSLDQTFINPGTFARETSYGTVYCIVLEPNGKVLVGGNFTSIDGINHNGIARLNADGSLDNSFNSAVGARDYIKSIAVQTDGKLLVGGSFNIVADTGRSYNIARLNTDGSLDIGFVSGADANRPVESVILQNDGAVILGGWFTTFNGIGRSYVARLLGDSVSPIALNIRMADDHVVLSWANANFALQSGSSPTGTYTNVPGAESPYTNPITGPLQYFRLKAD